MCVGSSENIETKASAVDVSFPVSMKSRYITFIILSANLDTFISSSSFPANYITEGNGGTIRKTVRKLQRRLRPREYAPNKKEAIPTNPFLAAVLVWVAVIVATVIVNGGIP